MKILVVDDSIDSAFVTGRLLEDFGHEILLAYDGPSALKKAVEQKPEAIIIDILMPGMDGYETCKRIRETPGFGNIFIIAFTGLDSKEMKEKAKQAGFSATVLKGVDVSFLKKQIEELGQSGPAD